MKLFPNNTNNQNINKNNQNLNKNNPNINHINLNNSNNFFPKSNNQYPKNFNMNKPQINPNQTFQINYQQPNQFQQPYNLMGQNMQFNPYNNYNANLYNNNNHILNMNQNKFNYPISMNPQMNSTFKNFAKGVINNVEMKNKFNMKNINNMNENQKKNHINPNMNHPNNQKNKLKKKKYNNNKDEEYKIDNDFINNTHQYHKNENNIYNENKNYSPKTKRENNIIKKKKKEFNKKITNENEDNGEIKNKKIKKLKKGKIKKTKLKNNNILDNDIDTKETYIDEEIENSESEKIKKENQKKPIINILDLPKLIEKKEEKIEKPEKIEEKKDINKIIPLLNGMCSEREMKEREEQNLLSIFELDPEKTKYDNKTQQYIKKVKPEFAIQTYTRPGGDLNKVDNSDLRTPKALRDTMNYIINEIIDSDHIKNKKFTKLFQIDFKEICLFVTDRFRAIRKNFTILDNMKSNKDCIICHEQIARFLIICLNETIDIKSISGDQGIYNLNMKELNLTLTSLSEFYEYSDRQKELDCNNENIYISPNKEEFISYFILFSLKQKPIEFMSILSKIPYKLRKGNKLSLALKISKAYLSKDAISFMKILKSKECDYLTACIMVLFFNDIRTQLMNILSFDKKPNFDEAKHSYLIYKMSIKEIIEKLPFENENEVIKFLDWFGINSKGYSTYGIGTDFNNKIDLIKDNNNSNIYDAPIFTNKRYVHSKIGTKSRKEIVLGGDDLEISQDQDNINKNGSFISNVTYDNFFNIKQSNLDEKDKKNIIPSSFNSNFIDNTIKTLDIPSKDSHSQLELSISTIKQSSPKKVIKISTQVIKNNYNENTINYLINATYPFIERVIYGKKCLFFSILKYMLEQYKIKLSKIKIFEKRRKHKIFSIIREYSINNKANKQYIKQLMNYGKDINLRNTKENIAFKNLNCNYSNFEFSLYTYDDLKYFLIEKYINDGNKNYINYLQVNIFTQKELIINSEILQNLNINSSLIKSNNNETIIYDSDIFIDNYNSLTLVLRFIYLDTIYNLSEYIFYNQKNMNKYTIGMIFLDIHDSFYQNTILQSFLTLMKDSLGDIIKKKLIFAFPYNNEINNLSNKEIVEQNGFVNMINSQYGIDNNPEIIQLGNVKESSPLYKKYIIYKNNKAFVELFSNKKYNIEKFDTRKKLTSLINHNNNIKYQFFKKKIENEFKSIINDNPLIIQLLLGISLFKISSKYYYVLFSNIANKLFNIPIYNSNDAIIKYENILIKVTTIFKLFNNAFDSFIQKCFLLNDYSIMNIFELFMKEIIDLDILYRENIINFSNEFKESFYKNNIEDNVNVNLINLFLVFFEKIIILINQELNNIVLDCDVNFKLFLSIYENEKEFIFSTINKLLKKTIDENLIKEYERYMNGKYLKTKNNNKFLQMKRFRNSDLCEVPNLAIIYNGNHQKINGKPFFNDENENKQIPNFDKINKYYIQYSII